MKQLALPANLFAGLGIALLAISSSTVGVLLAEPIPVLLIAGFRLLVTALAWMALRPLALREIVVTGHRELGRALWFKLGLAALLLALHFASWIGSLMTTTVVRSMALLSTQPLIAGALGVLIGDRPHRGLWFGAAVALIGSIGLHAQTGSASDGSLFGDCLAVIAAAAAAGYLLVGRSLQDRLPLSGYLAALHLLAAAMLLPLGLWLSPWPQSADTGDWLAVVYLGLVPGVVGHGLLNWAVRRVPVHLVSLTVLLEPILATAAVVWLLGRDVSPAEALSALVVLCGVGLGLPRQADRSSPAVTSG